MSLSTQGIQLAIRQGIAEAWKEIEAEKLRAAAEATLQELKGRHRHMLAVNELMGTVTR